MASGCIFDEPSNVYTRIYALGYALVLSRGFLDRKRCPTVAVSHMHVMGPLGATMAGSCRFWPLPHLRIAPSVTAAPAPPRPAMQRERLSGGPVA